MKKIFIISLAVLTFAVTGCGKVPKLENGQDAIVTYDKGNISADKFYEELKNKFGRDVLVEMIDTILLSEKYPETDELKKQVEAQVKYMKEQTGDQFLEMIKYYYGLNNEQELKKFILSSYRKEELVKEYTKNNITEDEIKKYYEEKIYGDIKASHILVSSKATEDMTDDEKKKYDEEALNKAKEIINRLNNGEDFATLAKELSDDKGSATDGGNVGEYNISSNLVSEFKEAGSKLEVGKYSVEPVKSQFGYHIILKVSQKDKPSMESVKTTIIDNIVENKIKEDTLLTAKTLDKFRKDNNVKIEDDNLLNQYNDLVKSQTTKK